MAKSLNTANEYPVGINQEHDKLIVETSREEKTKSESSKKSAKEESRTTASMKSGAKMHADETSASNRPTINQSQLITTAKHPMQSNAIKSTRQHDQRLNQWYQPMDRTNYKLSRLQCLNDCELCNKQTRSILLLQRELEMARCEVRSLRHYLLLSNSSKQPLNRLTYDDDLAKPIPPPQRYACSMPNTPKHRFECYDGHCQDCYFVDLPTNSVHNVASPCGLEHLLPNVNCSYSGCCLDEYADQAYEEKKTYESNYIQPTTGDDTLRNRKSTTSKLDASVPIVPNIAPNLVPPNIVPPNIVSNISPSLQRTDESALIGTTSKSNQTSNQQDKQSRLNRNRASLVAMQTFTLEQDDGDYALESDQLDAQNNNLYGEGVASNVKTQTKTQTTNPLFNRSKTSKSLTRSLSKEQYGSLNYEKTESFDEINYHQKMREQEMAKKTGVRDTNYETTC